MSTGSSLKNPKVRAVNLIKNTKKAAHLEEVKATSSLPNPLSGTGKYFDCACALLSRHFDRDRDRVLSRASQEEVCGIITWFSDIDKQTYVVDSCNRYEGFCYAVVGINPGNIHHTNKKLQSGWISTLSELAVRPECVGISTGLNLSRQMATHFAQETLFRSCCSVAAAAQLPLVLHIGAGSSAEDQGEASSLDSLERALEILAEEGWLGGEHDRVVVVYDALTACQFDMEKLRSLVTRGIFCMVSATALTDCDEQEEPTAEEARSCLRSVPVELLLACSDSPWKTPQNLDDPYLRTLRNEPCNMSGVVRAIYAALVPENGGENTGDMMPDDLAQVLKKNALNVFNICDGTESGVPEKTADDHKMSAASDEAPSEETIESPGAVLAECEVGGSPSAPCRESSTAEAVLDTLNGKDVARCVKCRQSLLRQEDVLLHAPSSKGGEKKSVFRVESDHCQASLFLTPVTAERSGALEFQSEGNVLCAGCRSKVGRVFSGGTSCICGRAIPGPVLALIPTKVDCRDNASATDAAEECDTRKKRGSNKQSKAKARGA